MATQYQPCEQLRLIPKTKIELYKKEIISSCDICKPLNKITCSKCSLKSILLDRYFDANIPLDFLNKSIENFVGDKKLRSIYELITSDPMKAYKNGSSYLFKGGHGTGKTMISSLILKKIVEKGFKGLYITLNDMINVLIYSNEKYDAARELKSIDFLTIDEFDNRFTSTEASGELMGRMLENVIRIRLQNQLPCFLISNNIDPTKSLGDALGASISSLISGYFIEVPVIGKDYRKEDKC